MSRMEPPRPAQAYQEYFVPAIFARWAPVLIGHAAPRPGERVLDVACGTGIIARSVAPAVGAEGRVVGLDISPAMLSVARALPAPAGAEIEWVEGDAGSLPGGGYDLILCQQGLQFFPDPEGAVREMQRVLEAGGRAVVSVWQGLERQPVYRALCEAEARHLGLPLSQVAAPFLFGDTDRLRKLFSGAEFPRVEVRSETRDVSFPSAEHFVDLTLLAASAVIPALAEMGEADRETLSERVAAEVRPTLERYVRDGRVSFPMHSNIVVARRTGSLPDEGR
jgi:ubiquinone/menaquinone biosynthesis C-methylase UbiE